MEINLNYDRFFYARQTIDFFFFKGDPGVCIKRDKFSVTNVLHGEALPDD